MKLLLPLANSENKKKEVMFWRRKNVSLHEKRWDDEYVKIFQTREKESCPNKLQCDLNKNNVLVEPLKAFLILEENIFNKNEMEMVYIWKTFLENCLLLFIYRYSSKFLISRILKICRVMFVGRKREFH